MTSLQYLLLEGPKVNDDHLAQLKGLKNLEALHLDGTKVTDVPQVIADLIAKQGDDDSVPANASVKGENHG